MTLYPILADNLRGVTHGFFTRAGGVSTGIYAGLNAGAGSDDDPDAVAENRDRIVEHLGADALVSLHQIHSADCAPVLFADREAGVIGAAHAGWKGALSGVLEATLTAMEALGAARTDTVATVGPLISQRAYEVGPEFADRFLDDDIENDRFFAGGQGDRTMFDLAGYCLMRLRTGGIGSAEWTGHCTYSDPTKFYSYRRSCHQEEPDYGRLLAAIMLDG